MEQETDLLAQTDPSKREMHCRSLGDDMKEATQTIGGTLNDMITDEQIVEIKNSITSTKSTMMLFSYIELVRKTLDFIEQKRTKQ